MSETEKAPAIIEGRPSDLILQAALRLGIPIEVNENAGTGKIQFGRRRDRADRDPCLQYLDECARGIHEMGMKQLTPLVEAFNAHPSPALAAALQKVQTALSIWEPLTVFAVCRCGPEQGVPSSPSPPPSWKENQVPISGKTWRELAGFTEKVAEVGVGAGAFGIAVAAAASVPVVLPFAIAASAALTIVLTKEIIDDPPDEDFDQIPVVVPLTRPPLDLSTLGPSAQSAAAGMLDRAADQISVLIALRTALERSWGAELAGQANERQNQLTAAADFADQLASILEGNAQARTSLVAELRADGLVAILDRDTMTQMVLPAFTKGPPPEFTSVIDHYASGTIDSTAIWWEQLGARMFMGDDFGAGVFPENLNPPEAAFAETQQAQLLRDFAGVWR